MRRSITLAVVAAMLLVTPAAFALHAVDPNDVKGGIDIADSEVKIRQISPGVFRMRLIAIRYDEAFDFSEGKGSVYWQLDTRGDGRADYEAYVFGDPKAVPAADVFCLFKSLRGPHEEYVKALVNENVALCGFPKRFVKITKDIRWRLAGRLEGVIDRAPNVGWYGG
jgi:hypothetical protein